MNPFKFGTIVDGKYFTDRKEELAQLKAKLDSPNHVVIISPRRFGKSSLVGKALKEIDRPNIKLDLQYVFSVSDFASQLAKGIFKLFPYEKIKHLFSHFRIIPTISTNAVSGAIEVSFQPSADPTLLLEDSMMLLQNVAKHSDKQLIVVLDEFQEVVNIQKGFDRQLRSIMQQQEGINYLMLGSQESMMEAIFEQKKSPFYHFGQLMRLNPIPYNDFYAYIVERMPIISDKDSTQYADAILQFTHCHPYYTQQLCAQVWEDITYKGIVADTIDHSIKSIIQSHDLDYERLWDSLNNTDKSTLAHILRQETNSQATAYKPQSTRFSSIKRLMAKGYLIKLNTYQFEDPFFYQWLSTKL